MTILEADKYIHSRLAEMGIRMHIMLDQSATELSQEGCNDIIAFAAELYEKHKQQK